MKNFKSFLLLCSQDKYQNTTFKHYLEDWISSFYRSIFDALLCLPCGIALVILLSVASIFNPDIETLIFYPISRAIVGLRIFQPRFENVHPHNELSGIMLS